MFSVKLFSAVLVVGILASLTACSPMTGSSPPNIEDITWKLASYGDRSSPQDILPGTEITILFQSKASEVQGFAGCNSYGGNYQINGVRLTLSPLISTKMACLNPPGVSDQEASYLQILQDADSFQMVGNTLQINSGNQILVYTR